MTIDLEPFDTQREQACGTSGEEERTTSGRGGAGLIEKIAQRKKEDHISDDIKQETPRAEIVRSREPLNVLPMGVSDKIRERECADQCNEYGPERE